LVIGDLVIGDLVIGDALNDEITKSRNH